ncbi:PREDICTED: ribosomal protein S6 kinase alpha-3-like [Acropora digitifera]|uniref:ribosomal protein S6 kinase alpha-3-like n=1 Tax=Acropora digitifera TaxID=70779 RepID=UPI00077ADB7C|nr:PREDICTED: ribosomal protein S6 kinase alpha-3-like [Acropora digitifera]
MPLAYLADPWQKMKIHEEMEVADEEMTDVNKNGPVDEASSLIDVANEVINSKACRKADPSQFELLKVLGQGSFGKVFLVRKLTDPDAGNLYAMKVLKKATLKVRDRLRTKKERDILVDVQHPFIVKLHYAFQTEGKVYLILDFLRGGDLFTRLSKELVGTLKSKAAITIIPLLLSFSILLDASGHVTLTDFGLSKESEYDQKTYSFCGTVEYMAPEVVNRRGHTQAADWWSFGVLMVSVECFVYRELIYYFGLSKESEYDQKTYSFCGTVEYMAPEVMISVYVRAFVVNRRGHTQAADWWSFGVLMFVCFLFDVDSPAIPPSATCHQLFRGFSFVDPILVEEEMAQLNSNGSEKMEIDHKPSASKFQIRTTSILEEYEIKQEIGRGSTNGLLMTPCYTANFVAPEVLKKQGYDAACDIWSLGVLLYTMLAGQTPFAVGPEDSSSVILSRIGEGKYSLVGGAWDSISDVAKDLVRQMLHVNPRLRLTAKQILQHPWVVSRYQLPQHRLHQVSSVSRIKEAVKATFSALSSPESKRLKPVHASLLAQRRTTKNSKTAKA